MTSVFDIIKIPFGYVLEWLYAFTHNYGLALILFAVAIKLILLPVSMKSKKSMMKTSRLAPRAKALELKYADDKAKYQAELMKLYKEEGVSTTGGCLWSLIPLIIIIPLYQVIREPLVYMMHFTSAQAGQIVDVIKNAGVDLGGRAYYQQLAAASHLGEYLPQIRAAIPELANRAITPINFSFLGLDLGQIPTWKVWTLTSWATLGLFLTPIVSGLSNWLTMWITQKFNNTVATNEKGEKDKDAASAINQSMKSMNVLMPLMSIWIGFQMPAGISIYWTAQALFGIVQEYFLTKRYRRIYDAEDAARQQRAAEEAAIAAEKERARAERRARLGEDTVDPNTSKRKLANKEKADRAPAIEGKLTPEQREALKNGTLNPDGTMADVSEAKAFSGDQNRPFSRGRAFKTTRYGRNTLEGAEPENTDAQETPDDPSGGDSADA